MTDELSSPSPLSVPQLVPGFDNRGVLRRRIRLASAGGIARGAVEDDFHHFEVCVAHDGQVVQDIVGAAWRHPWETCAGATDDSILGRLRGVSLGTDMMRRKGLPDPLQQCTHLYEIALLAIAQAARGGSRTYDIAVPTRTGRTLFPTFDGQGRIHANPAGVDGHTNATLHRDGELVLEWTIAGEMIVEPPRFAGTRQRDLSRWIAEHDIDDDCAEAIKVLRRGLHISGGRIQPTRQIPSADYQRSAKGVACFTFQPHNAPLAWRRDEDLLDFTNHGEALLADFPRLTHSPGRSAAGRHRAPEP
jgi:hypothetical protein